MSVVKKLAVTPNRIDAIYRYLHQVGERGEPRETLLALFSPPALQQRGTETDEENEASMPGKTLGRIVLEEAILLELVEEHEHDILKLNASLRQEIMTLPMFLEETMLITEQASKRGQANFPTNMAWFLMQEASRPLNFTFMPAQEIRTMFGEDRFELTNTSRTQIFYYWARYLGFSWWLESKHGTSVMVDPTLFLERHLPDLLRGQGEVPLRDLIAALAQRYLFFEGGTLRDELEELIPEHRKLRPNELASSTSLALKRLQQKGIIHLTNPSDAPKMTLLIWPQAEQFSHIALAQKDAQ